MKKSFIGLRLILLIIGTMCAVFVWIKLDVGAYLLLPLLPLACGLCYFCSRPMLAFTKGHVGICCLHVILCLRYFLMPLGMSLSGFFPMRGYIADSAQTSIAILLMLYEMIVVFLCINFFGKWFYSNRKISLKQTNHLVVVGATVLLVGLMVAFPQVLSKYTFVLSPASYKQYADAVVSGIIGVPFGICCLLLVFKCFEQLALKNNHKKNLVCFVLALLLVLINSSFISYTSRFSVVIPLVTGGVLLLRYFNEHQKKIVVVMVVTIISTLVVTTLKKDVLTQSDDFFNNGFFSNITQMMQSYLSGVSNVSIAITTKELFLNNFSVQVIVGDLFKSVMGISHLFSNAYGSTAMFNTVFYGTSFAKDQILPMIGQGYCYFGFALAPLLSVFSVFLMMNFDRLAARSSNIFKVYLYGYMAIRFGLFMMVNATILFSELTNLLLPFLLMVWLNDRFKWRTNDD